MPVPMVPSRRLIVIAAVAALVVLATRLLGLSAEASVRLAALLATLLAVGTFADFRRSRRAWRAAGVSLRRLLPPAFAIGATKSVGLVFDVVGTQAWRCTLFDFADPTLVLEGLPLTLTLAASSRTEASYTVTPSMRGDVTFGTADVRVQSRWGLCELVEAIGATEARRVYPDFAQVSRYAWLAGNRRLPEMGIKTIQRRGEGTDFKQLAEYRVGDSIRHIDWRATLRLARPIVRQFQDERDQRVLLMLDCGRRMRADERTSAGASHFDQVLNAVMLLSYVALQQGDAVGVSTFGTPPEQTQVVPPRKGVHALNTLMGALASVQPTLTQPDYLQAARDVLRRQIKRALVVIITNFRDEDSGELDQALTLLRTRHLVLLASVRERIVGDMLTRPVVDAESALDVSSARLYDHARRDAFQRLASGNGLIVDAEPERLGIDLVNRYHAVKRSGRM